jgi:DNA helicase-2/ATP-dependent DNA helicase PcrA
MGSKSAAVGPSLGNPVTARQAPKEHVPSENFTASDVKDLQEGQKVEHQKFGYGKIIKLEGASHNPIASIHFELNGEKKIMLNYAKLRIVEG